MSDIPVLKSCCSGSAFLFLGIRCIDWLMGGFSALIDFSTQTLIMHSCDTLTLDLQCAWCWLVGVFAELFLKMGPVMQNTEKQDRNAPRLQLMLFHFIQPIFRRSLFIILINNTLLWVDLSNLLLSRSNTWFFPTKRDTGCLSFTICVWWNCFS